MARSLITNVIIGGSTTSGFDGLSSKILALGQIFNQVGGKVGEWEKEAVETYKNYETYMLEAKGAMSANYDSASQLENEYNALQAKAQEWAGTTIFHTNDVAKAISEAAHAGWDYEKMLEGIPTSMLLAQAGNTDLSTGLDMLIKTINGTGIAFSESEQFVDQWVMAANSSATTVSELGEAMEKMGASARFGNSTAELLTMLGVLANTGTVGSAAGTLLRNSMIRLIAPTKNAREAMEGLGVEAEDINEAIGGDTDLLTGVYETLQEVGFSAYDSQGKLKPFLTTFKDLNTALTRLPNEEARNKVLSAIFPTRTITGAKALLEAAANDYDGLLNKILDSEGYAEKVAKIQTSGLMGSEELLKSKWEEFSRKIGEWLSEPIEKAYGFLGGLIDTLNSADPTILAAISGAATALAGIGPGLMTVGLAMKLFGALGVTGTAIMAGAAAIGAIAGYLYEINKVSLENNFGQMAIDMDAVTKALNGIGDDIGEKTKGFTEFSEAAKQAAEDYKEAGTTLSEALWSKMVTKSEITPDEQIVFNQQAEMVINALKTAIATEAASNLELASLIFSDDGTGEGAENNPLFASIASLIDIGMDEAIGKAKSKSAELRKAITDAFADSKLTDAEMQNIQNILAQMNELMDSYGSSDLTKEMLLNKSQRVSLKEMTAFSEQVAAARDAAFAEMDDQIDYTEAWIRKAYNTALKNGTKFIDPNTGEFVNPTDVNIDDLIASTHEAYTQKRTAWGADYNEVLRRGWQNALATSDTGALFTEAQQYLTLAQNGVLTFAQANKLIADSMSGDHGLLQRSLDQMIEYYGGIGEMAQEVGRYRKLGDEQSLKIADWIEQMIVMREALGGKLDTADLTGYQPETRKSNQQMTAMLADIYQNSAGEEEIMSYFAGLNDAQKKAWQKNIDDLYQQYDLRELGRAYDLNGGEGLSDRALEWLGAYVANSLAPLSDEVARSLQEFEWPQLPTTQAQGEETLGTQKVKIEPYMEGQDALASLEDQGVTVAVEGDAAQLQATIAAEDGQELMSYVNGDANNLHMTIMAEDGQLLTEEVTGNASQLAAVIESYNGKTITVNIKGNKLFSLPGFAEGGRATTPSIFGDAGAEWAIPEEHTQRTADLLNAAREASGFTWGELLERNGGLNAGGGDINVNISSYAPVIHANDATGVAEELAKDKARLGEIVKKAVKTALEDMSMREGIEVYA